MVFKDPIGAYSSTAYGPIQYPAASSQVLLREQQLAAAQQRSSSQSLQIIAPKPPIVGYHQLATHQFSHYYPGQAGPVAPQPPIHLSSNQFLPQPQPHPQPQPSKYTFFPPTTVHGYSQGQWRQDATSSGSSQFPARAAQDAIARGPAAPPAYPHRQSQGSGSFVVVEPQQRMTDEQLEDWEYDFDDEDDSMGRSDDESVAGRPGSRLGLDEPGVITSQRFDHQYHMLGTHTRTFSTHGAETVLATYDPSPVNSPLTDKHIAAVFWHFINVTGPSMSLYERHPLDPSNMFPGQASKTKQHQWTCGCHAVSFLLICLFRII